MGAPFSFMQYNGLICGRKYIPICAIDAAIGKSEFTKDRVKNCIMCCNTLVHDFAVRDIALLDQRRNDKSEFRRGGQDKGIGVGRTFAFDWSRTVLRNTMPNLQRRYTSDDFGFYLHQTEKKCTGIEQRDDHERLPSIAI